MNFFDYLKQQAERQDTIGDLARDAVSDVKRPRANAGRKIWRKHLEGKWAVQGALDALDLAWKEFNERSK